MKQKPVFLCADTVYEWLSKDYPELQKIKYGDIAHHTFQTVIEWEVYLPNPSLFQSSSTKIIRMNCGNLYHSSHIRFVKNQSNVLNIPTYVDEHWSLPHYDRAISFKQHIYSNQSCKTIPYIFGFADTQTFHHSYIPRSPLHILIMEPNINQTKTSFVPLIASVSYMKQYPERVGSIQVYCSSKIQTSIQTLLMSLNVQSRSNIQLHGRVAFPTIMKQNKNANTVIISHQNQNNLNNLYFDAIEHGIPLIHNSDAIKEIGWHYPDNDIPTIHSQLNSIWETESSSHLIRSYRLLKDRFSPYSPSVIQAMRSLLKSPISFISCMKPKVSTLVRQDKYHNKKVYKIQLHNNEQYAELGSILHTHTHVPLDIHPDYKVYFIHPLASYISRENFLNLWQGNHIYTHYWNLKDHAYPVGLSDTPIQGTINIAPFCYYLCNKQSNYLNNIVKHYTDTTFYFVLAEYTDLNWTDWQYPNVHFIRQNPSFVPKGDIYMPLFEYKLSLQKSNSTQLKKIGYFGTYDNLHPYIQSEPFQTFCKQHSIQIIISDQPAEWKHLQTKVDAIFAIRPDMTDSKNQKVASKLINAIRVGKPFICGNESAYLQESKHHLNQKGVLFVNTIEDVEKQILKLKQNYNSYKNDISQIQSIYSNQRLALRMWNQIFPSKTMIPKHYHQTYSNYNNLIPSLQKLIQTNIKTFIGNGWKYSFYNQTERAELIRTHFSPEVFSAYSMLNPEYGPAQADLFRYCLMYHFGGVYTDVKSTIPADMLDGLDQTNYDIFVSRWSTRMIGVGERLGEPYTPTGELCNWILISKPKQTFWLDFIHHICNKIRSWDNKLVGKSGVLRLTGPHCLTDFFNVYPKKENIFVFPRSNNKQAFAYDKANYNAIMSSGTAADHKKLFKHHYSTLTTPIVIHSSNTNTVS